MNQILFSFDDKNSQNNDNSSGHKKIKKLSLSNFQFVISIIILIVLIFTLLFYLFSLFNKENKSDDLINNYSVFKLYSNYNQDNSVAENDNNIFGIIEIPKINVYYPVFSKITDDFLKVAPCKISGDLPNKNGNLCIAAHNYNNSMFFSNLNLLTDNDEIYIYDNNNTKFTYYVFNKYEVNEGDLSPINDFDENSKELTLITCNNFNSKRIIVKAKQRGF